MASSGGRRPSPVGAQVPTARGLVAQAFARGREIGAETLQVFTGNPRGWALAQGSHETDEAFRALCEEHGVPVFVHAPYLVNLGAPGEQTYRSSIRSLSHNLVRASRIGARGVVVHTGSGVTEGGVDAGLKRVREALLPILESLDASSPAVLLEPTAGQGRSLCAGIDDLELYLAQLEFHPKVGICLDTCHVFAAGAPLDAPGGTTRTLDRLAGIAGPGRLQLVHANDSKGARGSCLDRHERIGQGRIGLRCFAELLAHPAVAGVPVVIETPGGVDDDKEAIALLKSLRPAA